MAAAIVGVTSPDGPRRDAVAVHLVRPIWEGGPTTPMRRAHRGRGRNAAGRPSRPFSGRRGVSPAGMSRPIGAKPANPIVRVGPT